MTLTQLREFAPHPPIGERDFSGLWTVQAYKAGYRAGEVAAETAHDIPHVDWTFCVKLVCAIKHTDETDLRQTVDAYDQGLVDGYLSREPMSDASIAMHFD